MSAWWYTNKGKQVGPVQLTEVELLLNRRKIGPDTLMWKEGMESWAPLGAIQELDHLKQRQPPPLPHVPEVPPSEFPATRPWPRLLARTFDIWWEALVINYGLALLLAALSDSFARWLNQPGTSQLFALLCLPIVLAFDAIIYRVFGNTPGKALLGIRVLNRVGERLGFKDYLRRNLRIWLSGLALGIPLISLGTFYHQQNALKTSGFTSYDARDMVRVKTIRAHWLKTIIFIVLFVALLTTQAVLNQISREVERAQVAALVTPKFFDWQNPVTKLKARIPAIWAYEPQATKVGQELFSFREKTNAAYVVFGAERFDGYDLKSYVQAFRLGTKDEMAFSDDGNYSEKNGQKSWRASGTLKKVSGVTLNVEIRQVPGRFWRVAIIQPQSSTGSNGKVDGISQTLWGTVQ